MIREFTEKTSNNEQVCYLHSNFISACNPVGIQSEKLEDVSTYFFH